MRYLLVAFLFLAAGEAGESGLGFLPRHLTAKDLTSGPLSRQYRNLQDCDEALEDLIEERFADIPGVTHSCKCGDPLAFCDSVIPETCTMVDCTVAECVESDATSVQVCFKQTMRTGFLIATSGFQGTATESSRTITTLYTRGVANVCD